MFYEKIHIFGQMGVAPYGVMVALGLLAAIVLGGRENQRIKLMTPELFEKVALWTVLWGLIFSRLFYVFTDLPRFMQKPGSIFAIWEGGLVFYGGPIGAVLYLVYHYVIRRSGPKEGTQVATLKEGWQRLLRFFDLGAPMLALAHAFGRIGCLCAGCCYGAVHEGALALHYPEGSPAFAAGGVGRYPIPLIESAIELSLFMFLMSLRLKKRFHGQVMLTYVMIYPAARFVLEMFRGDAVRGYVMKLETPALNAALGLDPSVPVMMTTSQFISLFVVAAAIVLTFVGKRAAADGPIPESAWWEDEEADEEEDEEAEEEEEEADEDEDEEADEEEEEAADEAEADEAHASEGAAESEIKTVQE
ncbi:prolipoprotein diacylglyceryl transferase [Enhygromyxa salina]|uniref:Phosphatidylglycerol--prolipoprotein diacylglyceryl transferase n=1 Tax=Enhygromyxa salina TaxID=215803 RepID=A0A2S9YR87_9BACT|nr:prolipoprotein diacylglyceryl transferase [Enhygromyxa salina]PRQ07611.1 Prolipoprotein diacylglyceryl transferase [Enhygromyxa salina]